MKKPVIFTDLDGTLIDYSSYSFEKALPALNSLKEKNIPLIICSSKTRKEIELYRKRLDNQDPFISENGGGIFIPKGYFDFQIDAISFYGEDKTKTSYHNRVNEEKNYPLPLLVKGDYGGLIEETDSYHIIRLGAHYLDIRKAISELREEGFHVKGFGDMTVHEIMELTGLHIEEAEMAKERDFDEPFVFEGKETENLLKSIKAKGFNYTEGRFLHIIGNSNKGSAVAILIEYFKRKFGDVVTVAIGDSPNDIPMLERVDYPIVVQKQDGSYDQTIHVPHIIMADGVGPKGWNRAILTFLSDYRLSV